AHAALALNDEDPGLPQRMRDMLCADSGIEDVTSLKDGAVLYASVPVTHFHPPIEDGEDLLPIIDVPLPQHRPHARPGAGQVPNLQKPQRGIGAYMAQERAGREARRCGPGKWAGGRTDCL